MDYRALSFSPSVSVVPSLAHGPSFSIVGRSAGASSRTQSVVVLNENNVEAALREHTGQGVLCEIHPATLRQLTVCAAQNQNRARRSLCSIHREIERAFERRGALTEGRSDFTVDCSRAGSQGRRWRWRPVKCVETIEGFRRDKDLADGNELNASSTDEILYRHDRDLTNGGVYSQNDRSKFGPSFGEDFTSRLKPLHGQEVLEERAYLVGIERKSVKSALFDIANSLDELAQLADTAGLLVVGSTYQKLDYPSARTYIGLGKVAEVKAAIHAFDVETVIFDDELSPGQLRNLEKAFGKDVRVCDRTALILDIFSQRAATREATLQVELAQNQYQLPRLTRMWTHLERQAGGMVKGMGEKQIEVDKRILRNRMARLKKELESVCEHRQHYRIRRASVPIPVVSLVGYTNAGKSTLLNRLSGAAVLTEDRLFATLDPTTRCIELPNGKQCLITDTVGFIQKLPTQLVASFRATLEEINDSSLLVHVVDISHPLARQQTEAVKDVISEINAGHISQIIVWNKVDKAVNQELLRAEASSRDDVICISALTGEGIQEFCKFVQSKLKESLVWVEALLPYEKGDLVDAIHRLGVVDQVEYGESGIAVKAHVPLSLARQMQPVEQPV